MLLNSRKVFKPVQITAKHGGVNMSKWADYVIAAVRFKKEKKHIEQVKLYPDLGEQLGTEQTKSRQEVVQLIEAGTTFKTVYKNESGKWSKGDDVGIVLIRGSKFIRTDGNSIEEDNLGELPEY